MKKSWVTFVLATTLFGLTGCTGNNNAANVPNGTNGVNNVRNNTNNGVNVRNVSTQNLRVSTRAINNVESLKEVDQAHVILRNNDAYVAVRLNDNLNNQADTGITGTPGAAVTPGTVVTPGTNGTPGATGITGTSVTPGTTVSPGTNGTTGTTGNNGTTGTTYKKVSTPLDKKIKKQVRAADNKIDNVYISYDTNFYKQMTNYRNDITNGRNRDGLWNNFTGTIRDFFR